MPAFQGIRWSRIQHTKCFRASVKVEPNSSPSDAFLYKVNILLWLAIAEQRVQWSVLRTVKADHNYVTVAINPSIDCKVDNPLRHSQRTVA